MQNTNNMVPVMGSGVRAILLEISKEENSFHEVWGIYTSPQAINLERGLYSWTGT